MAVFGVAITKEVPWRGGVQPISNVYHYESLPAVTFNDDDVINALVAAERAIFANTVNFIKARSWGPTDATPAESVTRTIKDLSGTGNATPTGAMYKEAAQLITWPLGRYGTRNRPQFLRKWLHTGAAHGYSTDGSTPQASTPLSLQTYIDAVAGISAGALTNYVLATAQGRNPTGPGKSYPYLEHRQFGEQWRRN